MAGKLTKDQHAKELKHAKGRIAYIKGIDKPLTKVVEKGRPFKAISTKAGRRLVRVALSHQWTDDPIMSPWRLPAGAFGEASGPI